MIRAFEGKAPSVPDSVFIAPGAVLIGDVHLGQRASVWFQSVLRADINYIKVGDDSNIQDACVLHVTRKHGLEIGKRVTVGHSAVLHGCSIGDDCLIAMGAIVLDGAVIGEGSIVGAGALIPPGMQVEPGFLLLGSPARPVRRLEEADRERVKQGWSNYIDYAARFAREFKT